MRLFLKFTASWSLHRAEVYTERFTMKLKLHLHWAEVYNELKFTLTLSYWGLELRFTLSWAEIYNELRFTLRSTEPVTRTIGSWHSMYVTTNSRYRPATRFPIQAVNPVRELFCFCNFDPDNPSSTILYCALIRTTHSFASLYRYLSADAN